MDNNRFDNLTRYIGEQKTRRNMIKAAAGSTLAVLGMGAARRVALGQDVSIESTGYQNDACVDSGDCRRGLRCDTTLNNPKCVYRRNCGGKKGDACKTDGQCCNGRNLTCDNRKCKRDKRNRKNRRNN
ncbi:MAG: Dickkopf N-terminal cysteine-rich region [Thermomicrobiales bacterium]|jgi:hypothetical protein|nr:Dickkopf N-terminal cysteine-rich region [Thermomicrobiales bacterium]MDF2762021.1 Dickkopf N-terminal cysteine-rich region [Thermomicrobiales bacterium]